MNPSKCVILVPVAHHIEQKCESSLRTLEDAGYPVWRIYGYAAIDQARNQMASDALRLGFTETLWIDSDIQFKLEDVEKLRKHDLPLVCGIYAKKGRRALAIHKLSQTGTIKFGKGGGLVEIKYGATGFLYVKSSAYLKIQQQQGLPICNTKFGNEMIPFFQPMVVSDGQAGYWYLAEDFAFFERARRSGIKVWADSSVRLWHIGPYSYGWEDAGKDVKRYESFDFNVT